MTPEEVFEKFDKDDNGTIEKKEIQKMLVKQVEKRVEAIFDNPDFNPDKDNKIKKDGTIDYDKFKDCKDIALADCLSFNVID